MHEFRPSAGPCVHDLVAACIAAIVVVVRVLPSELAPIEDRSIMRLQVVGPEGATYTYLDQYTSTRHR